MTETEIKLPLSPQEDIAALLSGCGFTPTEILEERDTYFSGGAIVLEEQGAALRIRRIRDLSTGRTEACITYKGPKESDAAMVRRELETLVADADTMAEVLLSLGYRPLPVEVKKHRSAFTRGSMNACVDTVEGLGRFLELEVMTNGDAERDEALAAISKVLTAIGHDMGETVKTSYLKQLIKKQC